MIKNDYNLLISRLKESAYFGSIIALLHWDTEVKMPVKGNNIRAQTIAYMSSLAHQKFLEINSDGLLTKLMKAAETGKLDLQQTAVVQETVRTLQREEKLPLEFVRELSDLLSRAHLIWVEARTKSNFKMFLPTLKKIVELKRKEAAYFGYKGSPYNALLETYEPGMTIEDLDPIFLELKNFLVPLIGKIKKTKVKINTKLLIGNFSIANQENLAKFVLSKMGFDLNAGRLDTSAHPFTTQFASSDVRLTTNYKEHNLWNALSSTIHEMGHGLYEQGLPEQHFGTPLAEAVSLGIHESQSRTWENLIGKSREFCKFLLPYLKQEFPRQFKNVNAEQIYLAINEVKPTLVRIESDEVTYNLHIILRYEIERALIEGTIEAEDLPQIWNQKTREYFGIKVPNDARGVLQDVHWSAGLFGYFPTYTLGNIYSAQFFTAAQKSIPNMKKQIAAGNFKPFLAWLRKHVHAHGKLHNAKKLIERATGSEPNAGYYMQYLQNKFSKIYKI